MNEVRVIGEMWMTHNAARISAATHPEIGAAYFIFECSYSCCFHSRLICLLLSCCTADCVPELLSSSHEKCLLSTQCVSWTMVAEILF